MRSKESSMLPKISSVKTAVTRGEYRRFNWRRSLALSLHALREAGLLKHSVVVLIGSYARGAQTSRSDVDLLVLLQEPKRPKLNAPYGIHLQFEDIERFRRRLEEGDDYVIAALKFGKPLHDSGNLWEELRQHLKSGIWPDWRDKIKQAERRIKLADELLVTDDIDAATEEYLAIATQISRAILLRHGEYPLARPELSKQLLAKGETTLAANIEKLIEGECDKEQLRKIASDL
ncbi:MAG TPA: nucleotidyltransferase domain-containing protein, partial [Anaerolineales bacterium]|nr:nucleotidyltransferase domain-containing protein [Anaerolineales bacterium]